ncbi:lysophospholipid acyltransferase family protein [Vibrio sp. S4M6]|uniref:lysophospholipid acyltransferase family protein n=1 Tax=Vibrio sinus TaxID=2946865 RepID=UPI002029C0C8|nr:GNAT family N-acyltransferase [Vibrio sinus]MCL9783305.1 lysophospholipid acyltransferase family protein [Vibrio sinus]
MQGSPFRLPRHTPFGIGESFVEWLTGLSKLDGHYQKKPKDPTSFEFMNYTLSTLGIEYEVGRGNTDDIPKEGPLVIVANHPLGAIEGVILADFIGRIRQDVKVLANELLKRLPEISELFIGIDVFEGKNAHKTNAKGVREAHQHLADGGVLIVFPAGEVSTYCKSSNMLADIEWSQSVAKFVKRSKAVTLPIYVNGKNSHLFYQAGRVHPLLRTALLGRELLNKSEKTIQISLGSPIPFREIKDFASDKDIVNYFRLNTYLMSPETKPETNFEESYQTPIIDPLDKHELQQELDSLPAEALLLENKEFSVYCVGTQSIPLMMREIGRVREESFRQVGEGSGLACDLDEYDLHYQQLFVWNNSEKELVGSYRLGLVDELVKKNGIEGLYSRSLFQYQQQFIDTLENCIEVGRSVVSIKYQRNINSLLLLWKGIATYVHRHPKYTHLFGPVSISNEYSDVARHLMAATLSIYHYDNEKASLVKPSTPLRSTGNTFWQSNLLSPLANVSLLSKVLSRMEKGKGLPVLLRQYLGMNGKLVCFNVDPAFNDTLDGLIVVNLKQVPLKTLSKYMGSDEAKWYLEVEHQVQTTPQLVK